MHTPTGTEVARAFSLMANTTDRLHASVLDSDEWKRAARTLGAIEGWLSVVRSCGVTRLTLAEAVHA